MQAANFRFQRQFWGPARVLGSAWNIKAKYFA